MVVEILTIHNKLSILYNSENNTFYFEGVMDINEDSQLNKIRSVMLQEYLKNDITINTTKLSKINSSCLCNFNLFFTQIKKFEVSNSITIIGNYECTWQKRCFEDFKTINNKIIINYV